MEWFSKGKVRFSSVTLTTLNVILKGHYMICFIKRYYFGEVLKSYAQTKSTTLQHALKVMSDKPGMVDLQSVLPITCPRGPAGRISWKMF